MSSVSLGKRREREITRFLDIEAQVGDDDDTPEGSGDDLDDFLFDDIEELYDNQSPSVQYSRLPSVASEDEDLEEIAREINRRASAAQKSGYRHDDTDISMDYSGNEGYAKILANIASTNGVEMYCFKIPPIRRTQEYLLQKFINLKNRRLSEAIREVFLVPHLPGRLFVLAVPNMIQRIREEARMFNAPSLIPSSEWASSQGIGFLPWSHREFSAGSWIRLNLKGCYSGDLAYVIGSSRATDRLLVAAIPRVRAKRTLDGIDMVTEPGPEVPDENRGKERRALRAEAVAKRRKVAYKEVGRKSRRPPPALFDVEHITSLCGTASIKTEKLDDHGLRAAFGKQIRDRDASEETPIEALETEFLSDLDSFEFVEGVTSHQDYPNVADEIHKFEGRVYFHGLIIIPMYGYGVVQRAVTESATLPVDIIIKFAEALIDPRPINALLSHLHMRRGDKVRNKNHKDVFYEIEETHIMNRSLTVSCFNPTRSQREILEIAMSEVTPYFRVGDFVRLIAGKEKGHSGHIISIVDTEGEFLSGAKLSVLIARDCEVEIFSEWVETSVAPYYFAHESHISVGDNVRVTHGEQLSGIVVELSDEGRTVHFEVHGTQHRAIYSAINVEKYDQNPGLNRIDQLCPWRSEGTIYIGDFITVTHGWEHLGRRGFVESVEGQQLIILETYVLVDAMDNSSQRLDSVEDMYSPPQPNEATAIGGVPDVAEVAERLDEPEIVKERFTVSSQCISVGDRIQLYDIVEVDMLDGGKVTGCVTANEINGYVVVQERIPAPPTADPSKPRDLEDPHPDDAALSSNERFSKNLVQLGTFNNHYVYRAYVRVLDRILEGDSVLVSSGPLAARRGVIKSISNGGQLILRPMTSELNTTIFHAHCMDVVKLAMTSKSTRHPDIGKRVIVTQPSSLIKGLAGYVTAYNDHHNAFVVNFISRGPQTVPATDLSYLVLRSNKEVVGSKLVVDPTASATGATAPATSSLSAAPGTPMPQGPYPLTPAWNPSADSHDYYWTTVNSSTPDSLLPPPPPPPPPPPSFLIDTVWQGFANKHIRVSFRIGFLQGALTNRIGYTDSPIKFDDNNNPSKIFLSWTDGKNVKRHDLVDLQYLEPAVPKQKNLEVMVLHGDHRGTIARVEKVVKKAGKIHLIQVSEPGVKWVENAEDVCLIQDHLTTFCSCGQNIQLSS